MRKVSDLSEYNDSMQEPTVDPNIFREELMFEGGVRGKNEHRKHVGVKDIIGRVGNKTYFRGSCWNCDSVYIGSRSQNRKRLLKCSNCEKTSFMYKGFFNNRDRYPIGSYKIPDKNEIKGTVYICSVEYSNMDPYIAYYSRSKYNEMSNKAKYTIEVIEKL